VPDDRDSVFREVRVAADPATVFAYLTAPDKLTRWAGTEATSDPRAGGVYQTVINPGHIISGRYVEVRQPCRLRYTWGWVDSNRIPPGSSLVEITLSPDGAGTRLTLTHTLLPEAVRRGHEEVWDHYLPRLARAAAGHDPGPDPWAETAEM
jgi:uncharacterized protein YndB with AHSA1/START domain